MTANEKEEWETVKQKEITESGIPGFRRPLMWQYPKAVRCFLTLFPNNYLDPEELSDIERLNYIASELDKLLGNNAVTERSILDFIRDKKAYFIIGSILLNNYKFGHHETFLFPEFLLGNSYKADFLLVGRSSGGYEFVFVELESPVGRIATKNGDLGEVFRKGLSQIGEWNAWLEANYVSLQETFQKYKHPEISLSDEFIRLDKTRIHYALIAGKRKDFSNKTYRIRREFIDKQKTTILHYDNLSEDAKAVIGKNTY